MNVTLSNNTFSGAEGIIIKKITIGKITIEDGKYTGPLPTAEDLFTITGGLFSEAPVVAVCADGLYPIANTDPETKDDYPWTVGAAVASITKNETTAYFGTLQEAVNAATDGDTVVLMRDASGAGIFVAAADNKNITIDLDGKTYTCSGPAVGSTGTATQAFHLEKNNTIKITNGTITSTADSGVKMLVQNYSNLTLNGVELDGRNLPDSGRYVLSNNNGNVVINDTTITAKSGDVAFDVCRYASYPSVNVTVTGNSTINGDIEIDAGNGDVKEGLSLRIESGEIHGEIKLTAGAQTAVDANIAQISKANSVEVAAPAGYAWTKADENGYQTLVKAVASITKGEPAVTTYYATLDMALAAADNDTIVVLQDIELAGYVEARMNATLDLNGKSLSGGALDVYGDLTITGEGSITGDKHAIWVNNGGKLTVENGTISTAGVGYPIRSEAGEVTINGGTIQNSETGSGAIYTEGTLTMTGGTVKSDKNDTDAIHLAGEAKATISGGTVTGHDWGVSALDTSTLTVNGDAVISTSEEEGYAISTNGYEGQNATINIESGTITGTENGVYLPSGTLNISGGTITGATAVYVKSGEVSINGGTLTATGAAAEYNHNGNGANPTGDALVVENCNYPNGAPTVSITGGSFSSANGTQVAAYTGNGITELPLVKSNDNSLTLPFEEMWVGTDGDYTLGYAKAYVDDTPYATLNDAIENCEEDNRLYLVKNHRKIELAGMYEKVQVEQIEILVDDVYTESTTVVSFNIVAVLLDDRLTYDVTFQAVGDDADATSKVIVTTGTGSQIIEGTLFEFELDVPDALGEVTEVMVVHKIGEEIIERYLSMPVADGKVAFDDVEHFSEFEFSADAVAKIGDKYFTTLAKAIEIAVDEDTVVLLKDTTADEIEVTKKITLDLAGFKISSDKPYLFTVENDGDLTITGNGKITGPANGKDFDGASLIMVDGGKLTIENGTLMATGEGSDGMYGVYVLDGGTAVFENPTITSHFAAIGTNNTTAPATIIINGGTYTANAEPTNNEWWSYFCAPIYAAANGTYAINGGTFNGYYGISSRYTNTNQNMTIDASVKMTASNGIDVFVDEAMGSGAGAKNRIIRSDLNTWEIPEGYKWLEATDDQGGYILTKVWTVTFDLMGGNYENGEYEVEEGKVIVGDVPDYTAFSTIRPEPNPAKENYVFQNWLLENEAVADSYQIEKDITFYADWLGRDITIMISDGLGHELGSTTKPYNTEMTAAEFAELVETMANLTEEVKTALLESNPDYTLDDNDLWTPALPENDVTIQSTMIYNLKWIKVHTVVFDLDGETTTVKVNDGSKVTNPISPDPEKEGYTFDGWYDDNNKFEFDEDGKSVKTVISDLNLKGKWTVNKYQIIYEDVEDAVLTEGTEAGEYDFGTISWAGNMAMSSEQQVTSLNCLQQTRPSLLSGARLRPASARPITQHWQRL